MKLILQCGLARGQGGTMCRVPRGVTHLYVRTRLGRTVAACGRTFERDAVKVQKQETMDPGPGCKHCLATKAWTTAVRKRISAMYKNFHSWEVKI